MFTGIIEEVGVLKEIVREGTNYSICVQSALTKHLKIDQSLSHNGICLTVVDILEDNQYRVTAIEETIQRTNVKYWNIGDCINLERSLNANGRLDGHMVQGHIDICAVCTQKNTLDGSHYFEFEYNPQDTEQILIEKGSVCVNGVSLTVNNPRLDGFGVAIIPYTYQHTNFCRLDIKDKVNIEFDLIGKYLMGYMSRIHTKK